MSDPVLVGFRTDDDYVRVWCPFCAKWRQHGYTADLAAGKTSRRTADCDHYGQDGYMVRLLTEKELAEIVGGQKDQRRPQGNSGERTLKP